MEYDQTVDVISKISREGRASVSFITPLVSVCLAALKVAKGDSLGSDCCTFNGECGSYAESSGLAFYLGRTSAMPAPGSAAGRSYCQLAKLIHPEEVNACNKHIGQFLKTQLRSCPNQTLVNSACSVVGELHDNIAAHAGGAGFSAAQFYRANPDTIQIAVADCGRGLRNSVRRSRPPVAGADQMSDADAILWCLKRGNTTAGPVTTEDPFGPQRLQRDAPYSPYPPGVETISRESHHRGEGLFKLTELVAKTGGSVWIWSGAGQIFCTNNSRMPIPSEVEWAGTAIAIELPVAAFENSGVATNRDEYETLARRLKL